MSTNYPNDYDSYPTWQDLVDIIAAAIINNIQDAIVAIEHELGKNPSGDYATVRERLDDIKPGGRWNLVEEVDIESAVSSYTFSNLNGDDDKMYKVVARIVHGYSGWNHIGLRFNGDSGNNYGYQKFRSMGTGVTSEQVTSYNMAAVGRGNESGGLILIDSLIYPVTGHCRQCMSHCYTTRSSCYPHFVIWLGSSWYNTTDNISSITIRSEYGNGLGVGTHLELWKRR